MRKNLILSAVVCITLAAGSYIPAVAYAGPNDTYKTVSKEGEQCNVEGNWVNSGEVNTVQESELAKEMIQAENNRKELQKKKAANAAENDAYGGAITIIAMCIVLSALVILSILFLVFGKISSSVQKDRKRKAHGVSDHNAEEHHDELDSGEVIAAISMALAEHMGQGHDMEDTILTIRRMRKAYSPWNSKIYNMRVMPVQSKPRR